MKKMLKIIAAEPNEKKNILNVIKGYQSYDVGFAKRYYDLYFADSPITEEDQVFVAKINAQTIGVAGYCRDYFSTDHIFWLGWLVVNKEFRNNKEFHVGTKLLRRTESEIKKRIGKEKSVKLFVGTEDSNLPAKSFYVKNKFRTEGVLRDYYYKGEDQVILSKEL